MQKAAELRKAETENEGYDEFIAGQKCYERGQYADAEYLLTRALDKSGAFPGVKEHLDTLNTASDQSLCLNTLVFLL